MAKRKSRQGRKRKNTLHIPHTVEEARKNSEQHIPAGWDNARHIKTDITQFEEDQIKALAGAIYEYMSEKDLTKPGGSWQDFILLSTLRGVYEQSAAKELMLTKGENAGMAQLKVMYENLPPEITASDQEIEQIVTTLKNQKPTYEDITYKEIVTEIAKLRGVKVDTSSFKQRNILDEVERIVDSVVKRHEQNKWLILIEGIVIGLISNGLFELLKQALASLVMRAPYTEAQIYEVESDVFRAFNKWRQIVRDTDEFDEQEIEIILFFALHAISVLSVLGVAVPLNPLFHRARV